MGSLLSLLILAQLGSAVLDPASRDTTTYADAATRSLVALGRARHQQQDTSVHDYQARIRYRQSFALGRRAWADLLTTAAVELEGRLAWQRPNDLRLDLLGQRDESVRSDIQMGLAVSRPFFVPRALGDSIRLFGEDDLIRAAPHPLSADGASHYRYAAGDSIILGGSGFRLVARAVTVLPKGPGPSYVAGVLWIDQATGDVVRVAFRFVGTGLWERIDTQDSVAARQRNGFVNQIVELDLQMDYARVDQQYWMPRRQVVSGRISAPFGIDVAIPFEAVTTFQDYEVNRGRAVVFDDSTAARPTDTTLARNRFGVMPGGGRWQVHRPPRDSLRSYDGWGDSLVLADADLARREARVMGERLAGLADALPGNMVGRAGSGIGLVRAAELFRYNRVQGSTFSVAGRQELPFAFTELHGVIRYGLADHRVMAQVQVQRDAPSGRLTVTGQRDLRDTDPWFRGLTLGSSVRAALTGHDDGSYLLALGGRAQWERAAGPGRELLLTGWAEDQRSVQTAARAVLPRLMGSDGRFVATPPIREGFAVGGGIQLEDSRLSPRWRVRADAQHLGGDAAARLSLEWRLPTPPSVGVRVVAGGALGADRMPQLGVQVGGVGSVRGYDVGAQRGTVAWAGQITWMPRRSRGIRPLLLLDVGQAAAAEALGGTPVLMGVGGGVALLGGAMRLEWSVPVTRATGRGSRLDLRFGGTP